MTITRRPWARGPRSQDEPTSRAGWYPVEAPQAAGPSVIEEQRPFRWLGQTPEERRTRLRGLGALVLSLAVTNGVSLFFWVADRPMDAPDVLVVQTPTGPVDVDAKRHILESCPASVAEVLEATDDPWRWYGGVEYLLWEVEPRNGHSPMVMVNRDTGEVVCP